MVFLLVRTISQVCTESVNMLFRSHDLVDYQAMQGISIRIKALVYTGALRHTAGFLYCCLQYTALIKIQIGFQITPQCASVWVCGGVYESAHERAGVCVWYACFEDIFAR